MCFCKVLGTSTISRFERHIQVVFYSCITFLYPFSNIIRLFILFCGSSKGENGMIRCTGNTKPFYSSFRMFQDSFKCFIIEDLTITFTIRSSYQKTFLLNKNCSMPSMFILSFEIHT